VECLLAATKKHREEGMKNTRSTMDEKLDGNMKRKAARCKRRRKDGTMKEKTQYRKKHKECIPELQQGTET